MFNLAMISLLLIPMYRIEEAVASQWPEPNTLVRFWTAGVPDPSRKCNQASGKGELKTLLKILPNFASPSTVRSEGRQISTVILYKLKIM